MEKIPKPTKHRIIKLIGLALGMIGLFVFMLWYMQASLHFLFEKMGKDVAKTAKPTTAPTPQLVLNVQNPNYRPPTHKPSGKPTPQQVLHIQDPQ